MYPETIQAKFEEQYEVYVSDPFFSNVYICAISKAYLALWVSTLSSPDTLKKLTPCENLDIRTQITGQFQGTSWSTISRDTAPGVESSAWRRPKHKTLQKKQFNMHRIPATTRYDSFNPSI